LRGRIKKANFERLLRNNSRRACKPTQLLLCDLAVAVGMMSMPCASPGVSPSIVILRRRPSHHLRHSACKLRDPANVRKSRT
jgi:hypothetical protein